MTVWYAGWNEREWKSFIPPCIPDSHPYRITSTKCRINTVVSPDDGHVFDRKHVEKRNKHTKKSFVSSWLYLQDYAVMQVNKT